MVQSGTQAAVDSASSTASIQQSKRQIRIENWQEKAANLCELERLLWHTYAGHYVGRDPEAAADALVVTRAFLAERLARGK